MRLTCLLKLRVESIVTPSSLILSDKGIEEPAISTWLMLLSVLSCHVMYLMSRHGMSCHVISRNVTSCHVMSRHVTSCHVMSRHVISCYIISRRKSRDGHATNASLSTDFFHTQSIQIKHDCVRWLS